MTSKGDGVAVLGLAGTSHNIAQPHRGSLGVAHTNIICDAVGRSCIAGRIIVHTSNSFSYVLPSLQLREIITTTPFPTYKSRYLGIDIDHPFPIPPFLLQNIFTHSLAMSKSEVKSLSESSSKAEQDMNGMFKPYPANDEFVQFTHDEGLEVLVLNEGSFNLSEGYSDKRVVLVLREYIHGKVTLDDARRTILGFLPPDDGGSGAFGSCMLHTAEQIPYNHPGGQAKVVQLLRSVYNSLGPGARNELGIEIYEKFERKSPSPLQPLDTAC